MTTNAGDTTVDLTGATLGSLSLTRSTPARPGSPCRPASLSGSATVNAGSLGLCVPAGVGLRIQSRARSWPRTTSASAGLVQDGSTWTTPGYGSAAVKIDLSLTANAGSRRARSDGRLPMNDRLYRSRDERMFAGVAGGVAERFDLDPSLVRVVWLILMFLSGGPLLPGSTS